MEHSICLNHHLICRGKQERETTPFLKDVNNELVNNLFKVQVNLETIIIVSPKYQIEGDLPYRGNKC